MSLGKQDTEMNIHAAKITQSWAYVPLGASYSPAPSSWHIVRAQSLLKEE